MDEVAERIASLHASGGQKDNEQLEVIFSKKTRLVVTAPAGYGKTKTMVSKIAYLISSGKVPNPKRVLALTFSVNAAARIRAQLAQDLPVLLSRGPTTALQITDKVLASNYHGFCRRVLRLYGYLLDTRLTNLNTLRCIDDGSRRDLKGLKVALSDKDISLLVDYSKAAKEAGEEVGSGSPQHANIDHLSQMRPKYLSAVKELLLPSGYIPYNAILLFATELFDCHDEVRRFYRSYFPVVIIDEFQDTNYLQWALLQSLIGDAGAISENTCLIVFGDELQRIYGFIGAIQGIMQIASKEYAMARCELRTNHRFGDNEYQLGLDGTIRKNARRPLPTITAHSVVRVLKAKNQEEEAAAVVRLIQTKLAEEPDARIAVLMRVGISNPNTQILLDVLNRSSKEGFSYFYALYSDEDEDYIDFHEACVAKLSNFVREHPNATFRAVRQDLLSRMTAHHVQSVELGNSLNTLLRLLLKTVQDDYVFLSVAEKVEIVKDVLEGRSLKQYLADVTSKVVLTTVHGAKGLEWDYVIVPDMERWSFPAFLGLCTHCPSKDVRGDCAIDYAALFSDANFDRKFLEELSTFYVAATRARRATVFTCSNFGLNSKGEKRTNTVSCFLKLDGFEMAPCDAHTNV